jgi:L-lactate dehydrogenase complex protein LldG
VSDSRANILRSIRQSLKTARHLPAAPQVGLAPSVDVAGKGELLDRFESELVAVGGVVLREEREHVAGRIVALARERGADRIFAWDEGQLPVPGLYAALGQAGLSFASFDLPRQEPERRRALAEAERLTLGLTGADAALAETGTLALRSGPGRPRLASLSVRTHIALFTPEQLLLSWAAWLAAPDAARRPARDASNLTLISGPSRTGDIEMTLTIGVHGPAEVIAIAVL